MYLCAAGTEAESGAVLAMPDIFSGVLPKASDLDQIELKSVIEEFKKHPGMRFLILDVGRLLNASDEELITSQAALQQLRQVS